MKTRQLLAALLSDAPVDAAQWAAVDAAAMCDAAEAHGVLPLIAQRSHHRQDVPPRLAARLQAAAGAAVAHDLIVDREVRRLIAAFSAANVPALVIKGTQLAYATYERPDLRPRLDTDVIVPLAARDAAHAVLVSRGYAPAMQVTGAVIMSQATYTKVARGPVTHAVDLHWRIANLQAAATSLGFDELAEAAVSIPGLGPGARGPCDEHALLIACIHRVAHHFDDDRLIWLWDIHLLSSRLDDAAWREVVGLAAARGVGDILWLGVRRAEEAFGTAYPAWMVIDPRLARAGGRLAALHDGTRRRQLHVLASDLRALPSWFDRWRLVREHLFPPAAYMRGVYTRSHAPLAVLYARRAVGGARKWLRGGRAS